MVECCHCRALPYQSWPQEDENNAICSKEGRMPKTSLFLALFSSFAHQSRAACRKHEPRENKHLLRSELIRQRARQRRQRHQRAVKTLLSCSHSIGIRSALLSRWCQWAPQGSATGFFVFLFFFPPFHTPLFLLLSKKTFYHPLIH